MLKKSFLCALLLVQCKSFTNLSVSNVQEAEVYVDGEYIGKTPCRYETTAPSCCPKNICLKKAGYKDLNVTLWRKERLDVGALIGSVGLFGVGAALPLKIGFIPMLCSVIPDLYLMKYKSEHVYTMEKQAPY